MSNHSHEIIASIGEFSEENSQKIFQTFIPSKDNSNPQKIVIQNLAPDFLQPGEALVVVIHPNENLNGTNYRDTNTITNEQFPNSIHSPNKTKNKNKNNNNNNSSFLETNQTTHYRFGNNQQPYPKSNSALLINKNDNQFNKNNLSLLYERKSNKTQFDSDLKFGEGYIEKEEEEELELGLEHEKEKPKEKEKETETEEENDLEHQYFKKRYQENNKASNNFLLQSQDRYFNEINANNNYSYTDLHELSLNSDSGLYITLSGFMIMFSLSNLLTNALTQQSHIAKMVFSGFGTLSMLGPPLIFLMRNKLDIRSVLRIQKAYVQKHIMTYTIIISVTLILSFFSLSVVSLIVLEKQPKMEQSLRIDGFGTGLLALITMSLLPAFCEAHMINNALTLLFSNTIQYLAKPVLKNMFLIILLVSLTLLLYTLSNFFKIYSISNLEEENFDLDDDLYNSSDEESNYYYEQDI
ncbi:atp-binding cassette transporter subfamily a abca [Anaeramoeba flamelloides]|uniref:Atp-binding cassette transporter subfamily a abca n=1 Tax=Anaeramoeba flamelloides TaxID=1746091 RepID=A0ABQ8XSY6_9EUKA|nr:atp-binding cassette transporter subfamily a abca [Anaeramoeba flamelloides]